MQSHTIEVYPNPGSDFFFLEHNGDYNLLRLYNAAGQLVREQALSDIPEQARIAVHDLPSGIYTGVLSGQGYPATFKVSLR